MKLRKSDFTGTGKVFRFTLSQMVKGKANIITMLIFFLFAAASIPIMTVMMGGQQDASADEAASLGITAVYVQNMSWIWEVSLREMTYLLTRHL